MSFGRYFKSESRLYIFYQYYQFKSDVINIFVKYVKKY